MADLIDRQAAIDAMIEAYEDLDAEWILKRLPSVQSEQKTGKWIPCKDGIEESIFAGARCSNCNYWLSIGRWNYCPHCGAKMEVEG